MKPQFEKRSEPQWEGIYDLRWGGYFRRIKTYNEIRQNYGCPYVRGKRRNVPTSWDDLYIARNWGRSWKDFTKKRNQYD